MLTPEWQHLDVQSKLSWIEDQVRDFQEQIQMDKLQVVNGLKRI